MLSLSTKLALQQTAIKNCRLEKLGCFLCKKKFGCEVKVDDAKNYKRKSTVLIEPIQPIKCILLHGHKYFQFISQKVTCILVCWGLVQLGVR